jgi:hypothetical protein
VNFDADGMAVVVFRSSLRLLFTGLFSNIWIDFIFPPYFVAFLAFVSCLHVYVINHPQMSKFLIK